MDVCTKQEPLDFITTEMVTIKQEQQDDYEAMVVTEQGNEKYNVTEEYKMLLEEDCKEGEQDPLSTNREYSNQGDDLELRSTYNENDLHVNLNKTPGEHKSSELEIQRNSLRSIRIHKGPIRYNSLEENTAEETQVKSEPEDEANQSSENSEENGKEVNQNIHHRKFINNYYVQNKGDNNKDNDEESPVQEAHINKYLKMWKILYQELDAQELGNIYQENKRSVRKAMDEMRLLNEERRQKVKYHGEESPGQEALDEMRLRNEEKRQKRYSGYMLRANKKRNIIFKKEKQKIQSYNLFLPEWRILYPLVDEEEQIHTHLMNNMENEQTMFELQQLNDERKKRISPEPEKQKDSMRDDQRNIGNENDQNFKLSVLYNEDQKSISVERIAIEPVCLRGIRIKKSPVKHNRVETDLVTGIEVPVTTEIVEEENQRNETSESSDDSPLQEVDDQRVEETNKNSETIVTENNEATVNDSSFQEWRIDKYLKMWKILYPMVAVKDQRNIYQENKHNARLAMDKMKQLNEERTIKHCPVCNNNKRRKGRNCKVSCTWLVSGVKPHTGIKKTKTFHQFIEEWKLLYPLVDVKEQVHLYVENNSNIKQTVSKLQQLNEERKKGISIELNNKIKDLTDSSGKESPKKPEGTSWESGTSYANPHPMHWNMPRNSPSNVARFGSVTSPTIEKSNLAQITGLDHQTFEQGRNPDLGTAWNNRYNCHLCGYRGEPKNIKIHMRKHTGEKPFKCTYCDYRAASKWSAKSHMNYHCKIIKSFSKEGLN